VGDEPEGLKKLVKLIARIGGNSKRKADEKPK
jgi:hypothetical protein